MLELMLVFFVGFTLFLVSGAVIVVWFALKAILWLVLLPFRLLFHLLVLPLLLLKILVVGLVIVVVAPVLALLAIGGLIAAFVAVLVPVLPFLLVGGLVYLLLRPARTALVR
jgi:hypothetical protein